MPDIVTASEDYASRFYGKLGIWFLKIQEKAVCDFVSANHSISILDVGGGHIQVAAPLKKEGYRVIIQGSAPECQNRMLENAYTRGCDFILSPVTNIPVTDRSYHTVLSFRLLAHYENWNDLVRELCRVADVNIIVDFPCTSALNMFGARFFKLKKKIEKNTRHWQSFHQSDIIAAFKHNGFRQESVLKEFFLPMVFYRILRIKVVAIVFERIFRLLGLTYLFGSPVVIKLVRINDT